MSLQDKITTKLTNEFAPTRIEVINESHLHAGHQPQFNGTGETHFRIRLVSEKFKGQTRIARHRAINDLIKDEFDGTLHALALELAAPDETTRW